MEGREPSTQDKRNEPKAASPEPEKRVADGEKEEAAKVEQEREKKEREKQEYEAQERERRERERQEREKQEREEREHKSQEQERREQERKEQELIQGLIEKLGGKNGIHLHFDTVFGDNAVYTENTVRAETISGSSIQGGGGAAGVQSRPKAAKQPKNEMQFEAYLKQYESSPVSCAILTAASLEVVSESRLLKLIPQLQTAMEKIFPTGKKDDKDNREDRFLSMGELVQAAFLERCTMERSTHAGKILIRCVRLESPSLGTQVRGWFWNLYPQFREPLFRWLLSLAGDAEAFLALKARAAMAAYAELDFGYTCERLLPILTRQADLTQIACLSEIAQRLAQNEEYHENVDKLLNNWLWAENSNLWMVGVQLYARDVDGTYRKRMPEVIERELVREQSELFAGAKDEFCFLIGLVRRSDSLRSALVEALARIDGKSAHYKDRQAAANIFLHLFMADYFMTDDHCLQLQLVRCLLPHELRRTILPMLTFIWGHTRTRKCLKLILEFHIEEYTRNGGDVNGLKPLFRALAFSGVEHGLEYTVDFLRSLLKNEHQEVPRAARLLALDLKGIQESKKETTQP